MKARAPHNSKKIGHVAKRVQCFFPTCKEFGVLSVPDNLGLGSGGVDHAAELDLGVLLDLHAGSGLETGDLDFRGWHCEERCRNELVAI